MPAAYRHGVSTLDNGLTVVTVAMPHLHSATLAVYARVGSRHETPETNGLSHFLEHMFFRGCDGFEDSTALNAAMEDLGGYLDAFTTRDHSGYQSTVHPRHIKEAAELLGRMFASPRFIDIDVERSIILEEILDALDERGRAIDLDTISYRVGFEDHPLGQSIDGPRKNVRRFSQSDLQSHRKRFYGAKNLVLCFAGAVDPAKCRKIAQKTFGGLFSGRPASEGRAPRLPKGPRFKSVHCDDTQTRCRLSFRTVSDAHKDYPALVLLRRVLDGGLSARLQVELVEKRGIVYEIGADIAAYSDCGLFDFELAVAHRKLAYALEELTRIIVVLVRDGVHQDELDRVRRRAQISLELGLDAPGDLAVWFGADRLFHTPVTPEARLAELDRITTKDLAVATRRYFHPSRLVVTTVGGADRGTIAQAKKVIRNFAEQLSAPKNGSSKSARTRRPR